MLRMMWALLRRGEGSGSAGYVVVLVVYTGMHGLLLLRRSKIVLTLRGNETPLLTLLLFSALLAREQPHLPLYILLLLPSSPPPPSPHPSGSGMFMVISRLECDASRVSR